MSGALSCREAGRSQLTRLDPHGHRGDFRGPAHQFPVFYFIHSIRLALLSVLLSISTMFLKRRATLIALFLTLCVDAKPRRGNSSEDDVSSYQLSVRLFIFSD